MMNPFRRLLLLASFATISCADADDVSDAAEVEASAVPAEQTAAVNKPIEITGLSAVGTGCPKGSFLVTKAIDQGTGNAYYQIDFDNFKLVADRAHPQNQSLDCSIKLNITGKKGYKATVSKLELYGYAILKDGLTAEVLAKYGFIDTPATVRQKVLPLVGPRGVLTDDREFRLVDQTDDFTYSRCDETRQFDLFTQLKLQNPRLRDGEITVNSLKGDFSIRVYTTLRPC